MEDLSNTVKVTERNESMGFCGKSRGIMSFDYPQAIRFKCLKCGICCGNTPVKTRHVVLLKTEVEKISEITKSPISEFAVEIMGRDPYSYEMAKTSGEGACVFLKDDKCAIYALRPMVCRFYPFELKAMTLVKHKFVVTDECPGVGKGKKLTIDYYRELVRLANCRLKKEQE